jgi:hypothetical protein
MIYGIASAGHGERPRTHWWECGNLCVSFSRVREYRKISCRADRMEGGVLWARRRESVNSGGIGPATRLISPASRDCSVVNAQCIHPPSTDRSLDSRRRHQCHWAHHSQYRRGRRKSRGVSTTCSNRFRVASGRNTPSVRRDIPGRWMAFPWSLTMENGEPVC